MTYRLDASRFSLVLACALALALPQLALADLASAQTLEEEMMEAEAEGGSGSGDSGTGTAGGTGTGAGGGAAGTGDPDEGGGHQLSDEQALYEEGATVESGDSGIDPRELPDENYYFLGVFGRGLIVPQFIQNLFVAEGATPVNGGFGLFFNWRRNGFNVQIEAFYQGFGVEGFYRGAGDPDSEFEFIDSNLGVVFGSIGFGWGFDITEWFAIELGFGIGFGGLVGDLSRQEAWRDSSTGTLAACDGVDLPAGTAATGYCEGPIERPGPEGRLDDTRTRGGTYQISQGTPNPHYFGDGGVPPLFFTIDLPRVAFRFKPIRQIQMRVEGAYNLYGFSFGASAAYGF